ncbi:hypothetical protein EMIHUDRAFT_195674 [Emiliania huxleyi CCMP1516]|uniref:G8 domain-containing protein n=2 Tax=Emiliania huxleyi TaxID=2903 RepID=A0A0D3JHW2_EMIH1|nr:hypothetical protein EMIHUDRAFT_195674 [Emiliania huxleyi CCMP1516]EOD23097.1 hypothetical protein EMIHUDRAFT_195674 [Emiliania huxleyi CCMP1516]|eukprot:XP_005775526.1 hypothetical protein EMIHUDRAFT_195674 [Emiliania huxleyi CCMP1516]
MCAPLLLLPLLHAAPLPWSEPSSWASGAVPTADECVTIPAGVHVALSGATAALAGLHILGTLSFVDGGSEAVELTSNVIEVSGTGRLEVGSVDAPFLGTATITLDDNNSSECGLTFRFLTLLARENATLSLHGAPYAPSWTQLASTAVNASQQLSFADAVNWPAGAEVVVASSDYDPHQAETATLAASLFGTTEASLMAPLGHEHFAAVVGAEHDPTGAGGGVDMRAEVGLLTRSVVVRGVPRIDPGRYNEAEWNFNEGDGECTISGHVILLDGAPTAELSWVGFESLGDEGQLGRYPLHFHLLGEEGSRSYALGSTLDEDTKPLELRDGYALIGRKGTGAATGVALAEGLGRRADGGNAGNYAYFYATATSGGSYAELTDVSATRGLTVAVLNPAFQLIESYTFDTFDDDDDDVQNMVEYIGGLPDRSSLASSFVLVGAKDEASSSLTTAAYSTLASVLGATVTADTLCYRCSYALVSRLGGGGGEGGELLMELVGNDTLAVSAGKLAGNYARFYVHGAQLTGVSNGRGLNIVLVSGTTFEVVEHAWFDTFTSSDEADVMVSYLEALSCPSCYVLVGAKDEASSSLTSAAYSALASVLGATVTADTLCYRCSYALVSRLGGELLAEEVGADTSEATSWCAKKLKKSLCHNNMDDKKGKKWCKKKLKNVKGFCTKAKHAKKARRCEKRCSLCR